MKLLSPTLWSLPFGLTLCSSTPSYVAVLDALGVPKRDRTPFPDVDGGAHVILHHNNKMPEAQDVCIVAIRPCQDGATVRSHLVHEAVHVWQCHCEAVGEFKAGAESMAYGIQNIYTQLLTAYNRQQRTQL